MGIRERRGGLIPRGMDWARKMTGGAPTGRARPVPVVRTEEGQVVPVSPGPPQAPGPPRPPAGLGDQLDSAQQRLKDAIPPPPE